MKIFVKARSGAKKERVEKIDESHFRIWVKEPPVRGRANNAIRAILAEYFSVPVSNVAIISGHAHSLKIIEITR